jgi:hypothetical protein
MYKALGSILSNTTHTHTQSIDSKIRGKKLKETTTQRLMIWPLNWVKCAMLNSLYIKAIKTILPPKPLQSINTIGQR